MALGTDSGDVLVIDIVTAEMKWKSSACLPGYDRNVLICNLQFGHVYENESVFIHELSYIWQLGGAVGYYMQSCLINTWRSPTFRSISCGFSKFRRLSVATIRTGLLNGQFCLIALLSIKLCIFLIMHIAWGLLKVDVYILYLFICTNANGHQLHRGATCLPT